MRQLQLRDAKAQFSALVDAAEQGEASVITRHGKATAVVIGFAEWQRLSNLPSFGDLLAASPLREGDLPPRDAWVPADEVR
jgi:prevent-host-death family protein